MLISEIFYSIQGEGILSGVPSVFVRTSGCNLRCNWCDTPYASWNPEGNNLTVDEALAQIHSHSSQHVVVTGGEPMIARDIRALTARLREAGQHITIETAATVAPDGIACDLASLSPKLSNSTPDERLPANWRKRHEELRLQPDVIREWIDHYPYQLKFVVSAEEDLTEIDELLATLDRPIPRDKILLMPEGVDPDLLQKRSVWLARICLERGFRFCPRLHIALYGNTRGT